MRPYSLLPWLGCWWLVILSQAQAQAPFSDHLCKLIELEQHQHPTTWPGPTRSGQQAMTNYDLRYHRFEWYIDPAVHYIWGTVTTYFVPTEPNVQTLFMQLSDSLKVEEIRYRGRALAHEHSPGDWLALYFPEPLAEGQLDSVSIRYQGAPPDAGRSFEQDEHLGTPIIWTLSQPYGAKDWWPCKQTLNDKADSIDIALSVPTGYTGVGNGVKVGERTRGDTATFFFQHRYPIPAYHVAIAATNYEVVTHYFVRGQDSMPVVNYIYPEDSTFYRTETRRAVEFMQIFDTLLTPYPFFDELYGHAQFDWPGGMEHQTMSFMYNFDYALVGHELAHAWAGNLVTCGSWQDIWINEGLTDYLTGMTYQYLFDGKYWPLFKERHLAVVLREPDGSVYVPAEDTLDVSRTFNGRLTYRKGALVLNTLRWTLGDEAFIRGLRGYFSDPELRFGYARTSDLQRHFEQAADTNLTEYFADWVYGEGYPIYTVEAEQTRDSLLVRITQRSSHPSVDFFDVDVPLALYFAEGDSQVVRLPQRQSVQRFALPVSRPIDSLRFDPELWLVAKLDTLQFWRQSVAPDGLAVYPQPVSDELYVRWKPEVVEVGALSLFDLRGTRLFHAQKNTNWQPNFRIPMASYPAGMYLLRLETPEGTIALKVVKQ